MVPGNMDDGGVWESEFGAHKTDVLGHHGQIQRAPVAEEGLVVQHGVGAEEMLAW